VFVSVTTAATGDEPIENAAIVAEEMHGWLGGVEGFEGLLMLYEPGTTIGLTFWRDREVAERNTPLRMQFLERIVTVASVEVTRIEGFDVFAAHPVSRPGD